MAALQRGFKVPWVIPMCRNGLKPIQKVNRKATTERTQTERMPCLFLYMTKESEKLKDSGKIYCNYILEEIEMIGIQ